MGMLRVQRGNSMKILKGINEHLEEYILILLSILTVIVIFMQVFMRYIIGTSLGWSEELARYAFIWMIYIGISYGVKRNRHLKVDVFTLLFKEKGKLILGIISNILFLLFCVLMTYYGFKVSGQLVRLSPALKIPMQWVYLAPVVGLFLTSIRIIQNTSKQIINFKSEAKE